MKRQTLRINFSQLNEWLQRLEIQESCFYSVTLIHNSRTGREIDNKIVGPYGEK